MRKPQIAGTRGSLKWIQRQIARAPQVLSDKLRVSAGRPASWTVEWLSPLEADGFAEYRDHNFLHRVRRGTSAKALEAFWPRLGPQWDALGVGSDGEVILVEAKANVPELTSTCTAGPTSRDRIVTSLDLAKLTFGAPMSADWLTGYYQYANRLAHLHFLRTEGIPALLVFLYFTGDVDPAGPATESAWQEHLAAMYDHLGLKPPLTSLGVHNVFLGTAPLNVA